MDVKMSNLFLLCRLFERIFFIFPPVKQTHSMIIILTLICYTYYIISFYVQMSVQVGHVKITVSVPI